MTSKKRQKELFYERKSAWDTAPKKQVESFSKGYKVFVNTSKTERAAVKNLIREAKEKGFKDISSFKKLSLGDKVFKIIKNRAMFLAVVGKKFDEIRLIGSHIDSPRLDLKPNPVFEDSKLAMLKSHYYGGIKKYQWMNVPLEMHMVVHTKKGKIDAIIGDKEDDPKFIVPDLLPHLAKDQMEKSGKEMISGEQLQIVIGNIPVKDDDVKEKVKFAVLDYLDKKYCVRERDFLSADISFVPAGKAQDIGFDKGLISAYGQDDGVCSYCSAHAIFDVKSPSKTIISFFADKEEIGSYGDTGAQSFAVENFVSQILDLVGVKERAQIVLERSKAISADVTVGMNPNFKDVNDSSNASYLGCGVAVEKYGGGGGKYSTNDASSEFMSWIVNLFEKDGIVWQTGELGKIDIGGGGTIAMFLSRHGMDCIDVGPAVLAMHSTFELLSKVDIYMTYKAYKSFFKS